MLEEEAQISAEMILIIGALLIIVIVVGVYVRGIAGSIAGNITDVINASRDSAIQKL